MKQLLFFLLCPFFVFAQTQIGLGINGEAPDDQFGFSVSLSSDGNIIAIGARRNSGSGYRSGHVRVYENLSGVWTQIGIDIDAEVNFSWLGFSVSLSSDGSILAVGAPRINGGNGNNSGQVRVYDLNALLSVEENVLNGFSLYPNPTKNILNIEANDNITSVEIYNLLGQQILTTSPNTLTEEIDMSGFNSGVYLVKVEIGGQTATYRVLKQ